MLAKAQIACLLLERTKEMEYYKSGKFKVCAVT